MSDCLLSNCIVLPLYLPPLLPESYPLTSVTLMPAALPQSRPSSCLAGWTFLSTMLVSALQLHQPPEYNLLCYSIGVGQLCLFLDTDEDTSRKMMQINFCAPRALMRGILPGASPHCECATIPHNRSIAIYGLSRDQSVTLAYANSKYAYALPR